MNDNFNLIKALQDEWNAVSESLPYREALAGWQEAEPALAGFESPAEVVAWCWAQAVPKEANRPVGALLRLAADPVAARTLLQVIIPGLNARIARGLVSEARCRRVREVKDELVQEVVVAAWERIAALAGTSRRGGRPARSSRVRGGGSATRGNWPERASGERGLWRLPGTRLSANGPGPRPRS